MTSLFSSISPTAQILLAVAVIWVAGFLMTRATKVLHLPNVTGYILAGVAIGPYALDIIPHEITQGMDFMTDMALSFIAFGVGQYLRKELLVGRGGKVIVLTIMESLVTAAIVTVFTMMLVPMLGNMFAGSEAGAKMIEIVGFKYFSIVIAFFFILFTVLTCVNVKEKSTAEMETVSVGQMFKALIQNDQAMTVTIAIVLINCSIYITSNLVIYFFKYDFGTTGWNDAYVLFNMFGGAIQVLSMMAFYPLLRKKYTSLQIFYICLAMAIIGYAVLLILAFTSMSSVFLLFIPAFFIFAANGMLTVITTVFLANTVDYGELKNNRRDESVIFSMQTFVVKLASGVAALVASICLSINHLQAGTEVSEADKLVDWSLGVSAASKAGLRMTMTIIPVIGLTVAIFYFKKRFTLTDERVHEIAEQVKAKKAENK